MSDKEEKQQKNETPETNIGGDTELTGIKALLFDKFQPLNKMKIQELREEVQMWRNLWSWVPSEVKYYISRTGQTVGVQIRNYQRYVGPLLSTSWDLVEIELGVYDKVFNQVDGAYYFERKISKIPAGQIVNFEWISERIAEQELLENIALEEANEQAKQEEPKSTT